MAEGDETIVDLLKDDVRLHGLETAFDTFYGIYRAYVMNTKDPDARGRIQISCPQVGHVPEEALEIWVDPICDFAGPSCGMFFPPLEGATVRVLFSNGRPDLPVAYFGGWFSLPTGRMALPDEFKYSEEGKPEKRGIVTRAGHVLVFNDEPGKESVHLAWHLPDPSDPSVSDSTKVADRTKGKNSFVGLEHDGTLQLVNCAGSLISLNVTDKNVFIIDQNGNMIVLDEDGWKLIDKGGNTISTDASTGDMSIVANGALNIAAKSINLKVGGVFLGDNAAMSAVLGEALQMWLSTHTHTVNGPAGPTSPPIIPPTGILSQKVKVA